LTLLLYQEHGLVLGRLLSTRTSPNADSQPLKVMVASLWTTSGELYSTPALATDLLRTWDEFLYIWTPIFQVQVRWVHFLWVLQPWPAKIYNPHSLVIPVSCLNKRSQKSNID
jgi:hypothetical protein